MTAIDTEIHMYIGMPCNSFELSRDIDVGLRRMSGKIPFYKGEIQLEASSGKHNL